MISAGPAWPAIFRSSGDRELVYIESRHQLRQLVGQLPGLGDGEDQLIDSVGWTFSVAEREGDFEIQSSGYRQTLEQILELVRDHAAQEGACCVAKLYAPSIPEAIAIVASMKTD